MKFDRHGFTTTGDNLCSVQIIEDMLSNIILSTWFL